MRFFKVAFGTIVAIVVLSTGIWSVRFAPWVDRERAAPNPVVSRLQEMEAGAARRAGVPSEATERGARNPDPAVEARPQVAKQGPFPQAVTSERDYQFGHMGINETRQHHFRIENKGEAPLVIVKGPTECKCTISSLTTHEVPPGASAEVEVSWTPPEADATFEKSAIVWTNDPQLSEIRFRISGKVGRPLAVSPTNWNAGTVAENDGGKVVGILVSDIDAGFKILSVEPSDRNVRLSYKPMSASALHRIRMLAGYEFTVSLDKRIPIGTFRGRVKILTTLEPTTPLEVELTAVRPGPIRFLPAVPLVGYARWNAEKTVLNLGRFRHEVGCKTALPAFVYDMPGKFQMLGAKSSDDFVKVSLEPNPASGQGQQQGIRFVFEVPPGSPPVNYFTQKPVHITVQTNHPALKNIDFDLQFVSL